VLKQQARTVAALFYAADLGATLAALLAAYALRSGLLPVLFPALGPLFDLPHYLTLVGPIVLIWTALLFLSGAYKSRRTSGLVEEVALVSRVALLGSTLLTLVVFGARWDFISRPFLLIFAFVDLVFLFMERVGVRIVARKVRASGFNYRNVVLVGDTPRARSMARLIHDHPWWGWNLLGVVREENGAHDPPVHTGSGLRVLGGMSDIPRVLTELAVDEVILAVDRDALPSLEDVFLQCEEMGVKTRLVLDFFPHVLARVQLEELEGTPLLTFSTTPEDDLALLLKRGLDVVLSVAIGTFSIVPLAVAALLIKLSSKGPILFRQTRCGLNGRPFTLLKLRTMVDGAEGRLGEVAHLNELDGPVFKSSNDPRITGAGRLIRRFSLDELPQVWNVLKGEMSLVGPRPPLPEEVARYERWQRRRLSMKPGVTGLWQVSGRNDIADFHEWLELDLAYIDNWSLALDAKILLRTIPTVLSGKGAR
jgi:exopolysaccharide biosynthesis polyprenyl glycosylphosphotransferase